jgi:hypothetical protein
MNLYERKTMDATKGQTFKYRREKFGIPSPAKENLKFFNGRKKAILDALKGGELTIAQLSEKLSLPQHEVLYQLMSLIKYGFVNASAVDDMDEYYTYKRVK